MVQFVFKVSEKPIGDPYHYINHLKEQCIANQRAKEEDFQNSSFHKGIIFTLPEGSDWSVEKKGDYEDLLWHGHLIARNLSFMKEDGTEIKCGCARILANSVSANKKDITPVRPVTHSLLLKIWTNLSEPGSLLMYVGIAALTIVTAKVFANKLSSISIFSTGDSFNGNSGVQVGVAPNTNLRKR